jgi:hypothetical protein
MPVTAVVKPVPPVRTHQTLVSTPSVNAPANDTISGLTERSVRVVRVVAHVIDENAIMDEKCQLLQACMFESDLPIEKNGTSMSAAHHFVPCVNMQYGASRSSMDVPAQADATTASLPACSNLANDQHEPAQGPEAGQHTFYYELGELHLVLQREVTNGEKVLLRPGRVPDTLHPNGRHELVHELGEGFLRPRVQLEEQLLAGLHAKAL